METFQFFWLRFHRAYDCLRLRFFIFTRSAFTTPLTTPTTTPSHVKTSLNRTNVGCPVIYSPACLLDVSSVHPLNLVSLCLLLLSTMVKERKSAQHPLVFWGSGEGKMLLSAVLKEKKKWKSHVRGRVHTHKNRGSSVNTKLTSLSEFAYCWISSTRVNFSWARFLTWSSNSSSSSSWSTVLWTSPRNVCSTNFRRKRSNYRRT